MAAKDSNGFSDPYVRVTLLPDKKHRLETKIKRRTLNPRWNETFYFEGFPINKLQSRVLHLHCFDYDRFSKDDSIGEIHLPLCQVSLHNEGGIFLKVFFWAYFIHIWTFPSKLRSIFIKMDISAGQIWLKLMFCPFEIVVNLSF